MPIFEFECPVCLNRIERIVFGNVRNDPPVCRRCGTESLMELLEFSAPARRNPEHGLQK